MPSITVVIRDTYDDDDDDCCCYFNKMKPRLR